VILKGRILQCCSRFFSTGLAAFVLCLALFCGRQVHAQERFDFYDGVREEAMGGTAVATVNDETSLMLNPAALGRLRNYFVTVFDPELEAGTETQEVVGTGINDFINPQSTLNDCNGSVNHRLYERAQLFPSFVVTNFGIGVFGRYDTDAYVDSTNNKFYYQYRNDFAGVMGFNFRLFDGRIKLGANLRAVNRIEVSRNDIPTTSTNLTFDTVINSSTVASEGFGIGSDVGILLTAPWQWLPTIGAVYRDVGETSYDINSGSFLNTTNRPARTPATLDGGISVQPIFSRSVRMVISAEMRDIMNVVEAPGTLAPGQNLLDRRLHAGAEVNFGDLFFVRAGWNQGYWTAGVEINMLNTQLQLASYGEEVGQVALLNSGNTYSPTEDRRYVIKFAYRY
jgi:hypothetical protein